MIQGSARKSAPGFTLLEMILALAIGLVLMISLYSVLDLQVRQAQGGRLALQEGTLARTVLTRFSNDILGTLGPVDPKVLPDPTASSSGSVSGANASAGSPGCTTTPSAGSSSTPTATDTNSTMTFNNGVYGTSNVLILTVSKVPRELNLTGALGNTGTADPTQQAAVCDLRRISYWMVTDSGQAKGLARQELSQVTSTDLDAVPPDVPNPNSYLFAPEVKDIAFQYWDGVTWQDQWDGTKGGGPNGDIPIGPPSAIAITITFNPRGTDNTDVPVDQLPKYRHVVAIPAGNNFPQSSP